VQASANLSEQFPNAQWTLQAELPKEPVSAQVFKIIESTQPTAESVREMANRFGMAGHIYSRLSGQTDFTSFLVIDGHSQLEVYGIDHSFNYIPDVSKGSSGHGAPLPYETMSQKATDFLKNRGLLILIIMFHTGYPVHRPGLDQTATDKGYPLLSTDPTSPEFTVNVDSDGEIRQVLDILIILSLLEPILCVLPAPPGHTINGKVAGGSATRYPPLPTSQVSTWIKQYTIGQKVETYGVPQATNPVDGSQP
jgi:hypothetical protein